MVSFVIFLNDFYLVLYSLVGICVKVDKVNQILGI